MYSVVKDIASMPKKGGKKQKKPDSLPDKFWALMPAPGTFNWFKVILFILNL